MAVPDVIVFVTDFSHMFTEFQKLHFQLFLSSARHQSVINEIINRFLELDKPTFYRPLEFLQLQLGHWEVELIRWIPLKLPFNVFFSRFLILLFPSPPLSVATVLFTVVGEW